MSDETKAINRENTDNNGNNKIDVPGVIEMFAGPYGVISNLRLIPDVRDGLLPVRRRILFTANEMGLGPSAKYRKAAQLVGEVMGKYHPHGDASIYMAAVNMAQDFVQRYPLIDPQGNFGSIDGDPPAAMRYTELRLSELGAQLVRDLYNPEASIVDWQSNYDGSLKEPTLLPARFPVLLANGTDGIGWGDATHILPHNLGELIDAVCAVIDPKLEIEKLAKILRGPDFPGGGILINNDEEWLKILKTGRGKITVRAKTHLETIARRQAIVVTELPYQVQKGKRGNAVGIIERLELLINGSKADRDRGKQPPLSGIVYDVRDESNRKTGMRLIILLENGVDPNVALNELYRHTDLQKTYNVNQTVLVNGLPETLGTRSLIEHYIAHQMDVLTRRTRYFLRRAEDDLLFEEASLIAHRHAEELVRLAKAADNREMLIKSIAANYGSKLSAEPDKAVRQAGHIADLPLRRYAKLDIADTQARIVKLKAEIAEYKRLLGSKAAMAEQLKRELREIRAKFGDERRTRIIYEETAELKSIEEILPNEPCWITISASGLANRLPEAAFRAQKRGGAHLIAAPKSNEDPLVDLCHANVRDRLWIISNRGNLFGLRVADLEESNRIGRGTNIRRYTNMAEDEQVARLIVAPTKGEEGYVILATAKGKVLRSRIGDFDNLTAAGLKAITLIGDDRIVSAALAKRGTHLIAVSSDGYAARFDIEDVPIQGRGSQGVVSMKLAPNATVVSLFPIKASDEGDLAIVLSNGRGKRSHLHEYPLKSRAVRGVITADLETAGRGKPTTVAFAAPLSEQKRVVLMTNYGRIIGLNGSEIKRQRRATAGVITVPLSNSGKSLEEVIVGGTIA